jgi:NADP-dependent 3-hydroxy acid dehydrogenase YdfG
VQAEAAPQSKVVLITGASSGIGWSTAECLAERGHRVVLCARRADRLEELRSKIEAQGGEALAVVTDVSREEDLVQAAKAALDRWGRIDVLVNNAGVMLLSPIDQGRTEDWTKMFRVNVEGLLFAIAAVLPTLKAQGSGHIVNVGSVAGRRPLPSGTVYAATKFAVRAISAGLQLELSSTTGIRVTDIEPGVVRTELMDHIPDATVREGFAERWKNKRPLEGDDIAEAIRYAIEAPDHVNVNEILIRPTDQAT